MMRAALPLSLVAASWAAVSCAEPPEDGSLRIPWRTGLQTCAEAGLATVRAELYRFGDVEPAATGGDACPLGETQVGAIRPGAYTLLLKGLDDAGCWTHEAKVLDLRVRDGEVRALDSLALFRRRRPLRVRWPFADGQTCADANIDQVEIVVEVEGLYSHAFVSLCRRMEAEVAADELPRGRLTVTVTGYEAGGTPVANGEVERGAEAFLAEPCSDSIGADVVLTPCDEPGCP